MRRKGNRSAVAEVSLSTSSITTAISQQKEALDMTTETQPPGRPRAPKNTDLPSILRYLWRTLRLGLLIAFGCMVGRVYIPYLLGDHAPMAQHSVFAAGYLFWSLVVSVIASAFQLIITRRRVLA